MSATVHFEFFRERPRLWTGRYARIPGETTAFHVRLIEGEWWPVVDWTIEDETAQCPMVNSDGAAALARAVNAGKRLLDGQPGGAFLINEYGQILVPSQWGERHVAIVGECEAPLEFWDQFDPGITFDLTDDRDLEPGGAWKLPYVGVPHNLSAASEIYFWSEDGLGGEKLLPPIQDNLLIEALRRLRPYGAVRFVVMCDGLVLTKVPVGHWSTARWEPRYAGRLNFGHWYAKEV